MRLVGERLARVGRLSFGDVARIAPRRAACMDIGNCAWWSAGMGASSGGCVVPCSGAPTASRLYPCVGLLFRLGECTCGRTTQAHFAYL